jgi:hypothetical protein
MKGGELLYKIICDRSFGFSTPAAPQRTVLVRPRRTWPCATGMSTVTVFSYQRVIMRTGVPRGTLTPHPTCASLPVFLGVTNNVEPHQRPLSLASNPNRHSIKRTGWSVLIVRAFVRLGLIHLSRPSPCHIYSSKPVMTRIPHPSSPRAQDDI